ncbi:Phosphomannomutase/phosphoglucomutase [Candidatus Arcanobacter lacustris]|uniref:Phosphomannomutase/phosphoglucomutase n=1 Tax=Candidatus Arcanibacter lacustris TaxID=1607817 RepID=A0A0F5MPU5_9RICK|nr:Phosphomannomutase/phosphoglucomutase [Candidatus Arcanobacter lacustris]
MSQAFDLQEIITNYQLDQTILREYDIRGIIGKTLSTEDAFYIGKAFASYVITNTNAKDIVVARDGRLSSPSLSNSLIDGILSTGANVLDIGVGPTPMLYFASNILNSAGAVMITGSHNGADYNGFKMVIENKPFFGADITFLGEMIENNRLLTGKGKILTSDYDIRSAYLLELLDACLVEYDLTIAWDPANGATGEIVREICDNSPGKHIIINEKIDGNFPNHHPDPSVEENLTQIKQVIIKNNCDFGLAFDGDGDRLVVIDDKGRVVDTENLISLFAADILAKSPGATIIADVKASESLFEDLTLSGANAIMWKTGHSFVKSKMAETGALFAGEMSGHLFFADKYYGFDDGLYAALRVIELMANSEFSLSKIIDSMPKRFISKELRIDVAENRKFEVIKEVKQRLTQMQIPYNDIDGIRVKNDLGWWLLRASNTQGAIVARFESYKREDLVFLKQQLQDQLTLSGIDIVL